jgi:hypothetical protein
MGKQRLNVLNGQEYVLNGINSEVGEPIPKE